MDDRNEEEGPAIFGGHGAALYNFGPIATATFMSKATFRDNVGGFVSPLFAPPDFSVGDWASLYLDR